MSYADMSAAELREARDEWRERALEWADDLANAIDAQDILRAAFMCHAYRQARAQVNRIDKLLHLGIAS